MHYYRYLIKGEEVPQLLESRTDFFILSEDDGTSWLYIPFESEEEAHKIASYFQSFESVELKDYVDWGVQWQAHCPDFKDYRLEIDLSKYTSVKGMLPLLYLNAGPGFGDLSHPTTRMMLSLMVDHVKGKKVLDIGSGSGILSLSAILLGALLATGLEIEEEAIEHAKENAKMNNLEKIVLFIKTEELKKSIERGTVILMNMIRSHQEAALKSLPQFNDFEGTIIVSGVLASERDDYLSEREKQGWSLIKEELQGDWMAFVFSKTIRD